MIKKILLWPIEAVWEAGKWIAIGLYRLTKYLIKLTIKYTRMTVLMVGISLLISYGLWKIWDYNLDRLKQVPAAQAPKDLQEIFSNIARVTEVTDRVPPLGMWADMESYMTVNAFTTGQGIYFTYVANQVLTEDEKALVMGHEIAHVILHHTDNAFDTFVSSYSNENELMADNVGAHWAHKAGYDVCKGREVFMKFYQWGGNSLNSSHPPNTIRYQNLEHYCNKPGVK